MEQYKIIRLIGHGNYGTCYLANDLYNNKSHVVLKLIHCTALNTVHINKICNEINILIQCTTTQHPNICHYNKYIKIKQNDVDSQYIHAIHVDSIVLVLEYCNTNDLKHYIDQLMINTQHIDEAVIWGILGQLLLGLHYIHNSCHVIHRDLKPSNILLHTDNNNSIIYKICDFGISKLCDNLTLANTRIGTPYYISPEIYQHQSYTYTTDVWSLGCIIYELCTLHRLYTANNIQQLSQLIRYSDVPQINTTQYSHKLAHIISLMLNKQVSQRPDTTQLLNHLMIQPIIKHIITTNKQYHIFHIHGINKTGGTARPSNTEKTSSAPTTSKSVTSTRPNHKSYNHQSDRHPYNNTVIQPSTRSTISTSQSNIDRSCIRSNDHRSSRSIVSVISSIAPSSSISNHRYRPIPHHSYARNSTTCNTTSAMNTTTCNTLSTVPTVITRQSSSTASLYNHSVSTSKTNTTNKPINQFMFNYLNNYVIERDQLNHPTTAIKYNDILNNIIGSCDYTNDIILLTYIFNELYHVTGKYTTQHHTITQLQYESNTLQYKYNQLKLFARQLYKHHKLCHVSVDHTNK